MLPPQFLSRGLRQCVCMNVDIYIPSDTGHTPHDYLAGHTIVANFVLVHVFCCTQSLFVSHIWFTGVILQPCSHLKHFLCNDGSSLSSVKEIGHHLSYWFLKPFLTSLVCMKSVKWKTVIVTSVHNIKERASCFFSQFFF